METVYLIFVTYYKKEDRLYSVYFDEEYAQHSVQGLLLAHKTSKNISGAYYKAYKRI